MRNNFNPYLFSSVKNDVEVWIWQMSCTGSCSQVCLLYSSSWPLHAEVSSSYYTTEETQYSSGVELSCESTIFNCLKNKRTFLVTAIETITIFIMYTSSTHSLPRLLMTIAFSVARALQHKWCLLTNISFPIDGTLQSGQMSTRTWQHEV